MSRWIFLRGLGRDSRHWGSFPDIFREEIPAAGTLALDLPGNGSLHAADSPADIGAMVAHCRAELGRRGVPPPYRVLAMSLGAMVAVAWANRYPQELEACVLINTSLRPFSPFHERLRPANIPALLGLALFGGSDEAWERTVLRLTCNLVPPPGDVLEQWVAWRRECPVSRRNLLRQLLAAARYRAPPARPAAPILILCSRRDALVDARCSQQLAARWHTALAVHPCAGHDIPLDDGLWVAQQVKLWLRALPS